MRNSLVTPIASDSIFRKFFQKYLELPALLRLGGAINNGPVAQIGCGNGYALKLISEKCKTRYPLHGYENREEMLRNATNLLAHEIMDGKVYLHFEDEEFSEMQKGRFASIFSFGALNHVLGWRETLGKAIKSLDDEGKIYMWEFYRPNNFLRYFFKGLADSNFSHEELLGEILKNKCKVLGEKNFMNMAGVVVIEKMTKH